MCKILQIQRGNYSCFCFFLIIIICIAELSRFWISMHGDFIKEMKHWPNMIFATWYSKVDDRSSQWCLWHHFIVASLYFRMYSYQSRVPPPPPPLSRAVIPSKRPRVSLSGGGSRRTKTSFSSSKSSQRSSRTSRYHSCVADVSRQTKLVITFFFSAARPPHSEGGRPADHQERAHADQTQGGLPAGEPGAHGEGPQQEVG